jgi:anti-sigma factor RsiW
MDHLDAEQMKAVERYTLGDLSVSEVEEFERHFFDCPQCSEELRALTIFEENARALFSEPDPTPAPLPQPSGRRWSSPPFFRQLSPALGALVIGILTGYIAFSSHERAEAVSAYPLYAQARGEETIVAPAANSQFFTLYLDRTWDGDDSSYRAIVRDSSGAMKFDIPVASVAPGQAIHVLVPRHTLVAGKYILAITGSNSQELARFPFTLRFP